MNRRNFIQIGSLMTSWALMSEVLPFLQVTASAQTSTADHFFVLLRVDGSMDVTLGLDPRTHADGTDQNDVFLEYKPEEIIRAGNLNLGPSAASLSRFHKDLLIVNGINMRRDAGHTALQDYMASGSGDGKTPSLPVELSAVTESGPLGLLINNSLSTGNRKIVMTQTQELLDQSKSSDEILNLLKTVKGEDQDSFQQALNGLFAAQAPFESFKKMLEQQKEKGATTDENPYLTVALAFAAGLSRQCSMVVQPKGPVTDLDTHSNHEGRHMTAQKSVWDSVSQLFLTFKSIRYKGGSLFDHTTFMVGTEFSRTPFLNNSHGKDHNPGTNSVLLAGKGIVGNTTVGSSQIIKRTENFEAQHFSQAMDFSNGKIITGRADVNKDVGLIFPENVARTIAKVFGDPEGFSSVSLENVRVLPGVVKA